MKEPISITSIASISALGSSSKEIWKNYQSNEHFMTEKQFENTTAWVAELSLADKNAITELRNSDPKYLQLDDSVLYAIHTSRKAVKGANWEKHDDFGINIGSSRGATHLFEKYHKEFLETDHTSTLASPTTTLGNISSWVAHDLQSNGPEISHSITCSTALHALLNGVAWIQAGMTDKFLVGGSEAALTEFTIAQMRAMKIYASTQLSTGASTPLSTGASTPLSTRTSTSLSEQFPCRAFDLEKKKNTMVIGEGAATICIEKGTKENAIATISGMGYATEILAHNVSISTEADCFQKSMKMALGEVSPEEIDVIVMHSPGTIKGDISEFKAIEKLFCNKLPFLTTNKWKLGHTFGASGMLSLELAILMLQNQEPISTPFAMEQSQPKNIKKVLVNAVGFGGNAVSILLTR